MRVLNPIRRNPLVGLAFLVVAIGGWAIADHFTPAPPAIIPPPPQNSLMMVELPFGSSPSGQAVTLDMLPKLRPGMTRVEVEDLIGPPPADGVQPVTMTDDGLRYRASYDLADPSPLATIRPIRRPRIPPPPQENGFVDRVAFVFDASKPGHPLIEVIYLDPLF